MHSRQLGFKDSACGLFTKDKAKIKRFKKTQEIQDILIKKKKKKMDKACIQHDVIYGNFKDLNRRTVADKILPDRAFNIAKNQKYDRYQLGFASMVY